MLNWLWAGMILLGVGYGAAKGNLAAVTNGALASAKDAVDLCIVMAGVMGLWTGIMKIAEKSGIMEQLNRLLRPLYRLLFPHIPKGHPAEEAINLNLAANILGLGWAATPAGLKAMEGLAQLEDEREAGQRQTEPGKAKAIDSPQLWKRKHAMESDGTHMEHGILREEAHAYRNENGCLYRASNEMCTFLIINISSLQLIPVNVIAYRAQYGSVSPAAITGPVLIATTVSTVVGIIFSRVMCRRSE